MDTPEDKFCWDNVEKLPGNECSRWKCKHGKKDFAGEKGDDIQSCEAVPTEIQKEAFKGSPMKRARHSPLKDDNANNKHPSSSSTFNKCCKSSEEIVIDKLMEFLISRNVSVNIIKDSHFRDFLRMVAQHGSVPSWLLHDDSVMIRRSLMNYEDVVNEYIRQVKESWKTTGFTYILYNMCELQETVISNPHDKENLVIGWYSPEGFFFTDGREVAEIYNDPCPDTDLTPMFPMWKAVQYIEHPRAMRLCHYQAWDLTDYHVGFGVRSVWCTDNRIQMFCNDICKKSEWVHDVIEKSNQIYTYMKMYSASPPRKWIQKQFEKVEYEVYESTFTHLQSIMNLKDDLEQWQSIAALEEEGPWSEEIHYIIGDCDFWSDGKELELALFPILEMYELVDSLHPTAGYLLASINEAKCNLKTYYDVDVSKYEAIWECFEEYFGDSKNDMEEVPSYLNPDYVRRNEANLNLSARGRYELERFVEREQVEALDAELEAYSIKSSNPFANLSESECLFANPFTLWETYGDDRYPLLKRCAMKFLSQPLSCMCNRVKKHLDEIQGSDNLILRLNYKMMGEFNNRPSI